MSQAHAIESIPDWIRAELENWARYCHSGPWPHPLPPDRVASAEGRYVAESDLGADVELDEQARRIPVHIERAEAVQAVYRGLDRRAQAVMKIRFVMRVPARQAVRKLRISEAMYGAAMRTVVREVSEAIMRRSMCN